MPFRLLRTQVEAVAQAVLGDHQRDVVALLVNLVGGVDQRRRGGRKGTRLVVRYVGEIAQCVLRVGHRRLDQVRPAAGGHGPRAPASSCSTASRRKALSCLAGRKGAAGRSSTISPALKIVLPSLPEVVAQGGGYAFGVLRRLEAAASVAVTATPSSSVRVSAKPSWWRRNVHRHGCGARPISSPTCAPNSWSWLRNSEVPGTRSVGQRIGREDAVDAFAAAVGLPRGSPAAGELALRVVPGGPSALWIGAARSTSKNDAPWCRSSLRGRWARRRTWAIPNASMPWRRSLVK